MHVQGCSIHCPGCFNPKTWEPSGGVRDVVDVYRDLVRDDPQGVTISGGEPLDQWPEVAGTLQLLRAYHPDMSVWVFSGYTIEEIKERRQLNVLASLADVLIAGPFKEEERINSGIKGSTNQVVLPFTDRGREEVKSYRPGSTEVLIDEHGNVKITGFPTRELIDRTKRELA